MRKWSAPAETRTYGEKQQAFRALDLGRTERLDKLMGLKHNHVAHLNCDHFKSNWMTMYISELCVLYCSHEDYMCSYTFYVQY